MKIQITGVLVCMDTSVLTEDDIAMWALKFAERAIPTELVVDPTHRLAITVEGAFDGLVRPIGDLGVTTYRYMNTVALHKSIRAWHEEKLDISEASDVYVALGIGGHDFCRAHLAFEGLRLSNKPRGDIVDLVEQLPKEKEWTAAWVNSGKPGEYTFRDLSQPLDE